MSTDMIPDSYWEWDKENPMEERCSECGAPVNIQIMRGTNLCRA